MRSFLFACTELETQQATRMWNRDRELNHGFRTCRKGSLLDSDTRAHVDLVVGEQGDEPGVGSGSACGSQAAKID